MFEARNIGTQFTANNHAFLSSKMVTSSYPDDLRSAKHRCKKPDPTCIIFHVETYVRKRIDHYSKKRAEPTECKQMNVGKNHKKLFRLARTNSPNKSCDLDPLHT